MNVKEVLNRMGYDKLADQAENWRTTPLYRPSDNPTALSINKQSGLWFDFVENRGGRLAELVQLTLGFKTIEEAEKFIGADSSAHPSPLPESVSPYVYEMEDHKVFSKELVEKLVIDHTYWINRGISLETVSKFNGGVCSSGKMIYRYVFPISNTNKDIVGFAGRLMHTNTKYPKWKIIGKKSLWNYPYYLNYKDIFKAKKVVLVESVGDMLALWDAGIRNVLVTFGLDISSKLIETLIRVDPSKVFISFNNDVSNNFAGNKAANSEKIKLSRYFDENQIIVAIPEQKDFGEMNTEQIKIWKNQFEVI